MARQAETCLELAGRKAATAKLRLQRSRAKLVAMKYVYILQSERGDHHYVGLTDDLRARLQAHNSGHVAHTSKFLPWKVKTYIAFADEQAAVAFERYLKTASGRAFSKKRL